eukprot:m.237904 g.237904  ORF g.237904 m.237904 type:complete len:193 (+) comp15280_c0_seq25:814-1392(+)
MAEQDPYPEELSLDTRTFLKTCKCKWHAEEWNLEDSDVGTVEAQHLAEALKINTSVTTIDLHGDDINADCCWVLHQASQTSHATFVHDELYDFERDLIRQNQTIQTFLHGSIPMDPASSTTTLNEAIALLLAGLDVHIIPRQRDDEVVHGDECFAALRQELLTGDSIFDWARRHVSRQEMLQCCLEQLDMAS